MTASRVFENVVPDAIWVSERPIWFGGVRLRSRTTVVRLGGGGLWIHSPTEPNDQVCAELDALGEVRWIVVPNCFHHLQAPATAARYPRAELVGPKSVRNPNVKLTKSIDDPGLSVSIPELTALPLEGVPFLDETVFFHKASGTLVGADLAMCACARDHWSWRIAARITGRYEKLRTPPDVRLYTRPNSALNRALERILALPIEQLLVAHADPITDRPREQLAEAWRFSTSKKL